MLCPGLGTHYFVLEYEEADCEREMLPSRADGGQLGQQVPPRCQQGLLLLQGQLHPVLHGVRV